MSEACRTLGYLRDTFYRLKKRYEDSGIEGLKEMTRRKPNLRTCVPEEVEGAVVSDSTLFTFIMMLDEVVVFPAASRATALRV